MRHLDEGTLQAWLDRPRSGMDAEGARNVERHLQTCASCAERLAELTHATERVQALLFADSTTVGEPADYEAVVARASVLERGRTLRTRWRGAAWAASVAVALGVGWVTNDLYRGRATAPAPPVPPPGADATRPSPTTAVAADRARVVSEPTGDEPDRIETPPEPLTEPSAAAELVATAPLAADTTAPSIRDTDVAAPIDLVPAPGVDSSRVVDARSLPPPPPPGPDMDSLRAFQDRTEVVEADRERDPSEPVARVVRGRVTDGEGRPLESVQVVVDGLSIGALTGSDGRFLLRLQGAATPELTIVAQRIGYREARVDVPLGGTDVAVADLQLAEQALALDEVVVSGAAALPPRNLTPTEAWESVWTAVSREEAARAADFTPLLIPNLPVRAIEYGALAGEPAVRVRHDVGGAILTLLQWSADASLSPPAPPDGGSVATAVRDGVVVTATARLPADSLRSLLEGVRRE